MAATATRSKVERYEYKFVRVGEYRGSALFGVRDSEREAYRDVIQEQARQGWRLVEIFAPGTAAFGASRYYELLFERPHNASAESRSGSTERHVDEVTDHACTADRRHWRRSSAKL